MENNELFQTIEQLKDTLSEVTSAREQVSETVKAYSKTQKEIGSYIVNLNEIEKALSSLITLLQNNKVVVDQQSANAVDNLKTSCDIILTQAKNEFAATSQRFSEETSRSLSVMSTQIERFDHSIEKANTLTNKVEATSKEVSDLISCVKKLQEDLVSSQKAQDQTIDNISRKQDETMESLNNQDVVLDQQGDTLNSLGEKISQKSKLIREDISKLSSALTSSTNSVSKSIEDLKVLYENKSAQILKGININRWIIVVGFVVLAILQYIFK